MNGSHVIVKPTPRTGTKPTPEILARLQQLRDEAAKKAAQMKRNGYH